VGLAPLCAHDAIRRALIPASPHGKAGTGKRNPFARHSARPASLAGLFLLFALILSGCAGRHAASRAPQTPPSPDAFATRAGAVAQGTFLDGAGRPLAGQELARALSGPDYILIGESHPSPCDHAAQAALLIALIDAGTKPAVGLEMADVTRQDVLAAFSAGKLAVADLPRALAWEKNWGFPFSLYAPIFELAAQHDLPVYALNLPAELARRAGARGLEATTPAEAALLPGEIIPAPERATAKLTAFFAEHAAMMPTSKASPAGAPSKAAAERLRSFLAVQALWDTQMAYAAYAARAGSGRPVLILAGGGHVEYGDGIAARLRRLDRQARILTVMPWRGGAAPEAGEGDIYFYCPLLFQSRLGFSLEMAGPAGPGGSSPTCALVTDVAAGSRAETAGLLPGDAVAAAGGKAVTALADLHMAAMDASRDKNPLALTVRRGGETLEIAVELPERK